ncbi:MAG: tetratricopeptide repeat protein [Phycisphaerae bacterium]|nr:tetratricopeptide repeat protein [Phycisphaerae bacterium]
MIHLLACVISFFAFFEPAKPSVGAPDSTIAAVGLDRRAMLQDALRMFDQALTFKDPHGEDARKLFQAALNSFLSVEQSGIRNGRLYFNIANTYMRLNDLGQAIVNYRRALRLVPGDPDVRRNLAYARSLCEVHIEPRATTAVLQTLLFWHHDTSPKARSSVAFAAYTLFWVLMLLMLRPRRRVPAMIATTVVMGLIAVAAGISAVVDAGATGQMTEGVVTANAATMRAGNGEAYDPMLDHQLPPGVEFRILESLPSGTGEYWHHVELPDGKDGWLRADQTTII